MNKLIFMSKKAFFSSLFLFIFSFFLISGMLAVVNAEDPTLKGLNDTAGQIGAFKNSVSDTEAKNFVQTRAGQIIGIVLSFVGVVFLVLTIYAGIMWMTAAGNSQQVDKAKGMLINSIIGLVVIFAAYAITAFVGDFVSNQLK